MPETKSPDEFRPDPLAALRALYGEKADDPTFVASQWLKEFTSRKRLADTWDSKAADLRRRLEAELERIRRNAEAKVPKPARLSTWWKVQKLAFRNRLPWNKQVPTDDVHRHQEWIEFLGSWLNRRILAQKIGRIFTASEARILQDMLRCSDRDFAKYADALRKDLAKWVKFFGE